MSENREALYQLALYMGDNALILGHRLSEWTGHGPVLEQDIAITNIALDLVGQARSWLQYAGELEGKGRTEDNLAYLRQDREFTNLLLVEQPNGHWGTTIIRQLMFDIFHFEMNKALSDSSEEQVAAIARKSLKEITYHLRYSSEWAIRLGDGTQESHAKMEDALEELARFRGELFEDTDADRQLAEAGISVLPSSLEDAWNDRFTAILQQATLKPVSVDQYQTGGRRGFHSEHLGFILAVMQSVQRAYPGLEW